MLQSVINRIIKELIATYISGVWDKSETAIQINRDSAMDWSFMKPCF